MIESQKGDPVAYRTLLQELYPFVRGYLRHRLGPLGANEDLVQDCILSMHSARNTYLPDRPFVPWLLAVVRYSSIDSLRQFYRFQKLKSQFQEHLVTFSEAEANLEKMTESDEKLGSALNQLPPELKQAILLTKLEGLSTESAAQRENVAPATLRKRVSRGYDLLKRILENEDAK